MLLANWEGLGRGGDLVTPGCVGLLTGLEDTGVRLERGGGGMIS